MLLSSQEKIIHTSFFLRRIYGIHLASYYHSVKLTFVWWSTQCQVLCHSSTKEIEYRNYYSPALEEVHNVLIGTIRGGQHKGQV